MVTNGDAKPQYFRVEIEKATVAPELITGLLRHHCEKMIGCDVGTIIVEELDGVAIDHKTMTER